MDNNQAAWLPFKKARPVKIDSAPTPTPLPKEVIIRVHAVAINPADNVVQDVGIVYEKYPVVLGCDAAGEIVDLGTEVKDFQKGDRVVVSIFNGAFQLYCPAPAAFTAKLPDHIRYTDACVLPLGIVTSATIMFEEEMLALTPPSLASARSNGQVLVIWGGSGALGSSAIQMASAAGYEVATTCSPHNFEYCKQIGATHVFDYNGKDVVQEIVKTLKGKASAGVFCTVFGEDTVAKCVQLADLVGGTKYVGTVYPPFLEIPVAVPEGVQIRRGGSIHFSKWLPCALESGTLRCVPNAEIVGKGLESIQNAMDTRAKGTSATKIVVEIS